MTTSKDSSTNNSKKQSQKTVHAYTSDQLQRYLFDNKHARGELVQLK